MNRGLYSPDPPAPLHQTREYAQTNPQKFCYVPEVYKMTKVPDREKIGKNQFSIEIFVLKVFSKFQILIGFPPRAKICRWVS